MNKAIISGRMTSEATIRNTPNGISVAQFCVAVKRGFKNAEGNYDSDFINVVAWRQTGDYIGKYGFKGARVIIEGAIQTRSYNAQDGSKRYVTEIIADRAEILDRRDNGAQGADTATCNTPEALTGNGGFTEIDDNELPF